MLHQLSGSTIDGAVYTVDAAGNRTSKADQLAGVTSNYSYDAIYELTQVTQGATTTESYSYDPVGNRLSSLGVSPYQYNPSNEMVSTPTALYVYDSNGNTTSKTDSTGTTSYTWDFENRLTQVTLPASGGTVTFRYDPFGRRIQKAFSQGSTTTTTNYVHDGDDTAEETDQNGNALAKYARTMSVDEPLAESRSGSTSYYETDGLGSITSLTSSAGTIVQTYTYDSFGKTTNSTGSLANPFRYAAREFDTEAGFYYLRNRYYDLNAGRFFSEDPIGFRGGINLYAYVGNNATNQTDPDGEGYVDCNKALAELLEATARVTARTAAIAAHGGRPDVGHQKALQQAVVQLKEALDKVRKHCGCYVQLAAEIAAAIAAAEAALEAAAPYLAMAAAAA